MVRPVKTCHFQQEIQAVCRALHCNTVISCFFGKHFGARVEIPETPHPLRTSAPFSPGRRLEIPPPSPRGEGGPPPAFSPAGAGRVRGHFLVAAPSLCAARDPDSSSILPLPDIAPSNKSAPHVGRHYIHMLFGCNFLRYEGTTRNFRFDLAAGQ